MYTFEISSPASFTENDILKYIKQFSHMPMSELSIKWSQLIQKTIEGLDIRLIKIIQNNSLVGLAFLTINSEMDLSKPFPLLQLVFKRLRWYPLTFKIGFIDIPLMHYPGLYIDKSIAVSEHANIIISLAAYLQKKRPLDALGIHFISNEIADNLLFEGGFIPKENNERAVTDYSFDNFEEYLMSLTSKTRRNVRKHIRIFENSGAKIEFIKDKTPIAHDMFKLFKNIADSKGGFGYTNINESLFLQLDSLDIGNPVFAVARQNGNIIAFLLLLQDNNTLYVKYCGLDYKQSTSSKAYFNLHYAALQYAGDHQLKKIDFGLSLSDFKKKMLSGYAQPLIYWFKFYHPILVPIRWILKFLRKM